jgi:Ca2+/Na+ antiporter
MTNTFKRRLYRLSLISTTLFLIGVLLYILADNGIAGLQFYPSFIALFAGILMVFRTLEALSLWDEDNSIDSDQGRMRRNIYPISFYTEAIIMVLLVMILLISTINRGELNSQEGGVFAFSLIVIGACVLLGRLSNGIIE